MNTIENLKRGDVVVDAETGRRMCVDGEPVVKCVWFEQEPDGSYVQPKRELVPLASIRLATD